MIDQTKRKGNVLITVVVSCWPLFWVLAKEINSVIKIRQTFIKKKD